MPRERTSMAQAVRRMKRQVSAAQRARSLKSAAPKKPRQKMTPAERADAYIAAEVLARIASDPDSLKIVEHPDPTIVRPPNRLIEADSATRKRYPMATGLLDYFPDALAAVSEVSFKGNQKHNPGEPMHHARGKSMDHPDCIMRHLTERGGFDGDIRHSAALAWRALALLQEELEREFVLPLPRGARI